MNGTPAKWIYGTDASGKELLPRRTAFHQAAPFTPSDSYYANLNVTFQEDTEFSPKAMRLLKKGREKKIPFFSNLGCFTQRRIFFHFSKFTKVFVHLYKYLANANRVPHAHQPEAVPKRQLVC